jgi:formate dehydrogenase subunit beta
MKVEVALKIEGDTLKAVRNFLAILLKERIVDFLLVPQEISHGRSLVQTLVKDAAHLDRANPFSPVMPMNSATIVSQLTADKPGKRLGVVLKPCEIRALIELTKLGQANLEDLVIIGTDCLGTYEVEDYARVIEGMEGHGCWLRCDRAQPDRARDCPSRRVRPVECVTLSPHPSRILPSAFSGQGMRSSSV